MAIVLGDNRYGKAETRAGPGRARHRTARDPRPHRLVVAARRLRRRAPRRRPGERAADRHPEEHRLRVREGARRRGAGGVRPRAGPALRRRRGAGDLGAGRRRGAPLGAATVDGRPHDHTFVRSGAETRTAVVTAYDGGEHVLSGLTGLVLLKSTGSEFHGFLVDELTTLPPTHDRVLATSLTARWRWAAVPSDGYDPAYDAGPGTAGGAVRQRAQPGAAADAVGDGRRACSRARADIAEIRMSAPNKHHYLVDLVAVRARQPGRGLRRRATGPTG